VRGNRALWSASATLNSFFWLPALLVVMRGKSPPPLFTVKHNRLSYISTGYVQRDRREEFFQCRVFIFTATAVVVQEYVRQTLFCAIWSFFLYNDITVPVGVA
jgi:hypothetical protein